MKTQEFIGQWKEIYEDTEEEKFLDSCIIRYYIPFDEKLNIAFRIADTSTHVVIDNLTGEKIFKEDSVIRHVLYMLNIIDLFTNIEVDFKDAVHEYDILDQYNVFEEFMSLLPDNEIGKIQDLIQSYIQDIHFNENNLTRWLDTKTKAISPILNAFSTVFKEQIENVLGDIDIEQLRSVLEDPEKVVSMNEKDKSK